MRRLTERLSNYFLLRDVEEKLRTVPVERRAVMSRACQRAEQKRTAAEMLWISGSSAEALRLARDAVAILREGLAAEPEELPELDAEVQPRHQDRYQATLVELDGLLKQHFVESIDEQQLRRLRITRIAVGAAIAICAVLVARILLRTPRVLRADASASFNAEHDASHAVDGSGKTEWLLPDHRVGWVDVKVNPPRKVSTVRVMNARNPPWNDRATDEFHVEVFSNGQLVRAFDDRFSAHSPQPSWRTFSVGAPIDRVRVTVKSHLLMGGGFSEIDVD